MSQNCASTVLVVEDDPDLRQLIVESLEGRGFAVAEAPTAADALARLDGFAYDALVQDIGLPDADGLDVLSRAIDRYPQIRCVVITGCGGIAETVRAMKRGAVDVLGKPFLMSQLAQTLCDGIDEQRRQQTDAELRADTREQASFHRIVGESAEMRQVFATLDLVAPLNSTVLLQGETGTGKELIARSVHYNSPRRDGPFVAFNAAAIPEGLVEAELFGHVKGAFTGAISARVGRFELAHKGTLFIDEVASMTLPLQAKLLRALQEREIERVGESRPFKFDIRVIAATNVDLRTLVKDGSFREDLFYRLNVVPITLPALRSRRKDIPLVAQHFVQKSCKHNGVPPRVIGQAALRLLMDYAWPGNVRELENAVEHAVAMSGRSQEITPEMLPQEVRAPQRTSVLAALTIPDEGVNYVAVLAQVERELIRRGLEKTGGNKRRAARLLNLSRTTLIDKMNRLGDSGDPH